MLAFSLSIFNSKISETSDVDFTFNGNILIVDFIVIVSYKEIAEVFKLETLYVHAYVYHLNVINLIALSEE